MESNDGTSEPKPILTDNFIYHLSNMKVNVKLWNERIDFFNLKPNKVDTRASLTLNMCDIVGSSLGKGHSNKDTFAYLTLYAYPRSKKVQKPNGSITERQKYFKRKRVTIELACDKFKTFTENLNYINEWHVKLESVLKKKTDEKPYLILVNPKSGAGKAKNIYYERIVPMLSEANLPKSLVLTSNYYLIK